MNKHLKYILILIGILALLLAGCSPEDPTLDSFYTEGDYNIRDDDGQWIPLENADFNKYIDLHAPATAIRLAPARSPTWVAYKDSSVLAFADIAAGPNEEMVYFTIQIPHSYKEGSALYPHVHWVPEDNTGGNVRWALTYSWANEDGVFPASTELFVTAPAGAITDNHNFSYFGIINGTGKTIDSILLLSVSRNSSDVLDTYTGKDANLLRIEFDVLADAMGSDEVETK